MKYLLDVNALVAWHHTGSPHHEAFHKWIKKTGRQNVVTCGQVELGFLRVSMQVFGYSRTQAQIALASMKSECAGFIVEAPSPVLPAWVNSAAKSSDGYLAQLAASEDCSLVTFDRGIPDAVCIAR